MTDKWQGLQMGTQQSNIDNKMHINKIQYHYHDVWVFQSIGQIWPDDGVWWKVTKSPDHQSYCKHTEGDVNL